MDDRAIVKYKVDGGEEIELSPTIVKQYLVSGNKQAVTDEEVMFFLQLCKYQRLNPFLNDAYLIKYSEKEKARTVVGINALMKRAAANPHYAGFSAGVITQNAKGELLYRKGTLVLNGETLVGGWCKVYRDDWKEPLEIAVSLQEYAADNAIWRQKPATMIRKVAIARALREVFPDLGGMYAPEEFSDATGSEERFSDEDTINASFTIYSDDAVEATAEEAIKDMHELQNKPVNADFGVSDVPPAEQKKQVPKNMRISEKQAKRLYAIAKGDQELLNSVLTRYGYKYSREISRDDYDVICDEVTIAVKQREDAAPAETEDITEPTMFDVEEDEPLDEIPF